MRYDHAFGCVSGEPPSGLSTPVARAAHSGSARWRDRATPAKYRQSLPQLAGRLFLTDGGIETTLIFQDGFELPYFAASICSTRKRGRDGLRAYYRALRRDRAGARRRASSWKRRPGAPTPTGRDKLGYDGARARRRQPARRSR